MRLAAAGPVRRRPKVAEWMTDDPDCVEPDAVGAGGVRHPAPTHGYRHIPVVEGDDLVGIVSMRDLMRVAQIQPVVHPARSRRRPGSRA